MQRTPWGKRHPVALFYLLAFALSWLGRVPLALSSRGLLDLSPLVKTLCFLLGGAAPTLAAVLAAQRAGGGAEIDALFAQFRRWRVGLGWYLLVLLGPIGISFLAFGLDVLLGNPAPNWTRFNWLGLPFLWLAMFLSYVWEEIGWRGGALPCLACRRAGGRCGLACGWAFWPSSGICPSC